MAGKKFLVSDKYSTADTTLGAAFKLRIETFTKSNSKSVFAFMILSKPAFQNLLGVDERKKFENLTLWYSGLMEDEKLKKHFKVQLTDKRKEFNAADIKVKYKLQIRVPLKKIKIYQ